MRNLRVTFKIDPDKSESKVGKITVSYNAPQFVDLDGNERNAENWSFSERVDLANAAQRSEVFRRCADDFKAYLSRRKVERAIEAELTTRLTTLLNTDDPSSDRRTALQDTLDEIQLRLAKEEITLEQSFDLRAQAHEDYGADDRQKRTLAIEKARHDAAASKALLIEKAE